MNRIQPFRRLRLATLGLTLGAVLVVSSLPAAAPALAAGTAAVRIDPATVPAAGPGAGFSVQVVSNTSVNASGIQTSVTFDKTLLQITALSRPATGWGTAPTFIGPTGDLTAPANVATAISQANGSGKLATIAANLTPPAFLPSGVDQGFLNITFQVIGCPVAPASTTLLGLPTGAIDAVVLDGTGDPAVVTATGSIVTPCSNNTGNAGTRVTSTLDPGFLALQVDANFNIPLIRQVTNTANVPVKVFSDGVWTLNVSDAMPVGKNPPDRGHMTNALPATKRLADPMKARYDAEPLRSLDQPFANTNVTSGTGTATPVVTLSQFVGPTDPPANYSIVLVFTATSGF